MGTVKCKEEIGVNWSLKTSGTSAGPCRLVVSQLGNMGEPSCTGNMCLGLWGNLKIRVGSPLNG